MDCLGYDQVCVALINDEINDTVLTTTSGLLRTHVIKCISVGDSLKLVLGEQNQEFRMPSSFVLKILDENLREVAIEKLSICF